MTHVQNKHNNLQPPQSYTHPQQQSHHKYHPKTTASYPKSSPKPTNEQGNDNVNQSLQILLQENNMTLYELLNSSISQFAKHFIDRSQIQAQNQQLIEQNMHLQTYVDKLKVILREKLQSGLKKQLFQINLVLNDYMSMINKLLNDKEMLTNTIQQLTNQNQAFISQHQQQKVKIDQLISQNQHLISKEKTSIYRQHDQITEQLAQISSKYESRIKSMEKIEENAQERLQCVPLQKKYQIKKNFQSQKIQILLDLLQKSEEEAFRLKQQLKQGNQRTGDDFKQLELKMQIIERQHEQEFEQYERAIRQSLTNKDKKIQNLQKIIKNYRLKLKINPQSVHDSHVY